MPQPALALCTAVRAAVRGKVMTVDLGGNLGTREAGDWLGERVAKDS